MLPILYIVIPCYNEEKVLPITCSMFLEKITGLVEKEKISDESRILFVNDGSRDQRGRSSVSWQKQTGIIWESVRAETADIRTRCWQV